MTKGLRIYYYAVFGAFGGLLGWFVSQLTQTKPSQVYAGAVTGFFVGATIGATDSLLSARWRRAAVVGAMTGALCLVAGAVSLWIGDELNTALKGGLLPRCLAWMIFGSAVGAAETIRGGSQASKGLIGGAMGGFFAGFVVEHTLELFSPVVSGALGSTILGASIGAFASLIATILMGAWIEILDGKMKGRVYDLSKYIYSLKKNPIPAVIGSDEFKAEIYVMGDPGIAGRHASVRREEQNHVLKDLGGSGTWVNGNRVEEHFLRDGDCIRVGATSLLYREKRAEAAR